MFSLSLAAREEEEQEGLEKENPVEQSGVLIPVMSLPGISRVFLC